MATSLILLIISIFLIVFAFIEKRTENQQNKKGNTLNIVATTLLVFSAIITYYSGCQNEEKDRIAEENRGTIDSLIKENAQLNKVQFDSIVKILLSSKELLKYHNNDDSLIIIKPYRNGNVAGFTIENLSDYPAQFVVVNYPNKPFIDSMLAKRKGNEEIRLTREQSERWRKQIELSIDGRRSKDLLQLPIREFNKDFEMEFDVKWSNRFVRYSYVLKYLPNEPNSVRLISQKHFDRDKRKYFILLGDQAIYN